MINSNYQQIVKLLQLKHCKKKKKEKMMKRQ